MCWCSACMVSVFILEGERGGERMRGKERERREKRREGVEKEGGRESWYLTKLRCTPSER